MSKKKQDESVIRSEPLTLRREIEYDTLQPEAQLKQFLEFTRSVTSRINQINDEMKEIHDEELDIDHYAELHGDLGSVAGYQLYQKLRDMRRRRRQCKSELEVLDPVAKWIETNQGVIKSLEATLGNVRRVKSNVDNRVYTCHTDIFTS